MLGDGLLGTDTGQWLTDWDVISVLTTEAPRVRGNLLQALQYCPFRERKNSARSTETQFHSILGGHRLIYMWSTVDRNLVMQHMYDCKYVSIF